MDDGLKQRLVGAVVLSAVAVLFVPVLFDQHDKHKVDTVSQIPSMPNIDPVDYQSPSRPDGIDPASEPDQMFIPEGGNEQALDGQKVQQADTPAVKTVANSQAEPFIATPQPGQTHSQSTPTASGGSAKPSAKVNRPAEKPKPKPTAKPAPEKRVEPSSNDILKADGTPNAWVLQVISSSSEEKAKNLVKQLQDKNYAAYYRSAKTPKGLIYRVYVGPKINRSKAERLKRELDKLLNVDALILRFQP
ncbi:SPOR domain-containing protein [Pseudoteredinibacter isoporae]|uniref:SPOR domain-containing protein n=1 Tax=Pseudoteredinibacter isoporae TaxID=570281 RepID=UPI00310BBEAB